MGGDRTTWGLVLATTMLLAATASATPSTQVWVPSTDIQKAGTLHLNYDVYARPGKTAVLMLGPTVGLLPFEKVQAEAGFDLIFQGNSDLDDRPFYGHLKLATPEDAAFVWSPAIAVGIYNVGTNQTGSGPSLTGQNIGYALAARTLPYVGRLTVGWFYANPEVFRNENGARANQGLVASWDRTLTEVTDKLWVAVDYQGSRSMLGAVNAGVAWSFASNVSVIVGYDHYLNRMVAGKDTFTVQLDVNLAPFESPPAAPPES